MAVYAIADLHLPFGKDKSMEVFGPLWKDYTIRIEKNWNKLITLSDTVVIAGDFAWAMGMEEALPDFRWIDALPGKKLLIKGNHDYYWASVTKMRKVLSENGIHSVDFIHNSCAVVDGLALCGTRGWFTDEGDDKRIFDREFGRLRASLASAPVGLPKVCFLHYPPICKEFDCPEIQNIMEQNGVSVCYYGHLHGSSLNGAFKGVRNGVRYECISGDGIGFMPVLVRI